MSSYNKVILLGNLTRDPEHRVTPGGLSICKLGMAVNRRYTKQNGEKTEEVTYVDIDCFGKQADLIVEYLNRGDPLFIEGRLKFDTWASNTGEKRSKLSVVMESFQFMSRSEQTDAGEGDTQRPPPKSQNRRKSSGGGNRPPSRPSPPPATVDLDAPGDESLEDDVPF